MKCFLMVSLHLCFKVKVVFESLRQVGGAPNDSPAVCSNNAITLHYYLMHLIPLFHGSSPSYIY